MATRAERFRATVERSGPKQTKGPARPRRNVRADTAAPGVSETLRVAGGASTGRRNLTRGKNAAYALEDSAAPKRPSRKSSRRSSNRQKAAPTLKGGKVDIVVHSPQRRHSGK